MTYRSRVTLPLLLVAILGPRCSAAESSELELLDEPTTRIVWQRLVEARQDLDVLTHARFISNVPAVPSGNGISPLVAGVASLAWFREDLFAPDARAMRVGWTLSQILKREMPDANDSARAMVAHELLKRLRAEYVEDLVRNQSRPPKVSKREVFVRTIQEYYDRSKDGDMIERLKEAIRTFLRARDLTVGVLVEDASWERCQQAVNRDLPFLCLTGSRKNPRVFVCVGYAEANNRRYLLVVDPENARLRTQPLAEIINDVDRAVGGHAVAILAKASGDAVRTDFHFTQPRPELIPGLVAVGFRSPSIPCLFLHKWREDEQAVQDRLTRMLKDIHPMK